MKKYNKSKLILPVVFFLLFALASGEDVPWIEILLGSVFFSAIATLLTTLVYKFFTLLFNPKNLINREEVAVIVDEILEERGAKID